MMRFIRLAAIAVLALPVAALSAHASTVTYNFTGDSPELTGDFVIDTSSGSFSGSFSVFDGTNTYTFNPATDLTTSGVTYPFGNYGYDFFTNAAGDEFQLLAFLAEGPSSSDLLCSLANPCTFALPFPEPEYSTLIPNGGSSYFISNGSVTPASATPEPSSFALLGTGALGFAGMVRRRLRRN
ncbi:MAG TPA: PEP-CTERM sorting domain-containing protein [Acidobacteriaceae bacterium]|jgi:hypothetical protein